MWYFSKFFWLFHLPNASVSPLQVVPPSTQQSVWECAQVHLLLWGFEPNMDGLLWFTSLIQTWMYQGMEHATWYWVTSDHRTQDTQRGVSTVIWQIQIIWQLSTQRWMKRLRWPCKLCPLQPQDSEKISTNLLWTWQEFDINLYAATLSCI